MNYKEVRDKVFSIIADKMGIDMDDFSETSSYFNDLGADLLDAVELMMEFEFKFGISVNNEEFEWLSKDCTVEDSIVFICKKLNITTEKEEYVKIVNSGSAYTTHPRHIEYGCTNYAYNSSIRNDIVCKVIKRVNINESLPGYKGEPGASLDFNGTHYLVGANGFVPSTKEEYDSQFEQKINQPEIKIEQKMKVKCINQHHFKNIIEGGEYEVLEETVDFYIIKNTLGNSARYSKNYFEIVPEPIIEDIDEIGVEENQEDEINIAFNGEGDIDYEVNGNDATLEFYEVASNCGVKSYHGINYLFENCDCNKDLFKNVIEVIIEEVVERNNSCMLIFSTNNSYMDIWTVLDEVMDFSSEAVENPNSDTDVKLWIKYTN